ncbi:CDGSH iron-sulfur domain-containing protein [Streptomyces sp. NPDC001193]
MPSPDDDDTCRVSAAPPARRVSVDPQGPLLVEGPVEIVLDDGTVARSDRFMVAVCTCRRSRTQPWCDTSHRRRRRPDPPPEDRSPR